MTSACLRATAMEGAMRRFCAGAASASAARRRINGCKRIIWFVFSVKLGLAHEESPVQAGA